MPFLPSPPPAPAPPPVLLLLLLALGTSPRLAADDPPFTKPGPFPVGVRTLILVDSTRHDPLTEGPRTLVTEVWYPAVDRAPGKKTGAFLDFFGAHPEAGEAFARHFGGVMEEVNRRFTTVAVRDEPARSGKFPLLVFSHGNGGLRHQNVFQMDHLASHGYVVASPDHTGNAGVTVIGDRVVPYDRKGRTRSMEDRPRDASFVIDELLAETRRSGGWLEGRLDSDAIGALGHSFGGYTVTKAAELDPRIRAILPMTLAYSKPATVPMLLMLGALDRTVSETGNMVGKAFYVSSSGPKHLLVLERGGHYSFSDMDRINPSFGDGIGKSSKGGKTVEYLDSDLTKRIINGYTLAFFDAYLKKDAGAREFLARNAFPGEIELRHESGKEP